MGERKHPRLPKGEEPQPAKEEDRRPAANTRMPPRLQLRSHARSDFALAVYPDRPQKEACIQVAQDIAVTAWLRAAMYDARRTPIVELADALLPATRIVTLPGNASDMKGVHLHFGPEEGIRIIGAHTQAMFVHGKAEQEDDDAYIIMPDAAKRLREALLREMDGDDAYRKEVKLLTDLDDHMLCCECEEYRVFVR